MLASVRNQLARGEAALAFIRTSPTTDPSVALLVEQLNAAIAAGNAVIQSRGEADNQARVSKDQRDRLRRRLRRGLLRSFVKAGEAAAESTPALAEEFRQIVPRIAGIEFGAGARSLAAAARAHLPELAAYGITEGMVDQAEAMIGQWEQLAARTAEGRRARSQARLAVAALGGKVMKLVTRLDAIFQHIFADQPERLGSWRLAIASTGPIHRKARQEAKPGSPTGPGTPPPPTRSGGTSQAA